MGSSTDGASENSSKAPEVPEQGPEEGGGQRAPQSCLAGGPGRRRPVALPSCRRLRAPSFPTRSSGLRGESV